MANEFKHVTVGTEITQAEYESITGHAFDSQARGDLAYASSSSQLSRLAIGGAGAVLTSDGTDPVWDTTWSPTGHLIPASDDSYDLGSASAAWQDLFLEGDITLTDAGTLATSAGALTVTSAAAATWSTSAGALTLNGTGGVNLQEGGSTIISISDARALATTNTASVDLDATGAIQINSSGGALSIGNDNVDQTINIATAGTRTLNIGIGDGTDITTTVVKGTLSVGVDDAGYDVVFYGDTASANMTWDTSVDDLILNGAARIVIPDGQLVLGSTAVSATAAELNLLDGGTSVGGSITIADADGFVVNDGGTMKTIPASDLATYITAEGAMNSFQLEDDSGDEVTINNANEIKFIGSGIDINWTDTDNGTDADPYDLTFTLNFADLSDVTPVNGDKLATLDSDGSTEQLTTVASLATLFAGAGMTATSSVLNVIGGDGITANANDVAVTAANTNITSIYNASLAVGYGASHANINFATDNQIIFDIDGTAQIELLDGILQPVTDVDINLGATDKRFQTLYGQQYHMDASDDGITDHSYAGMSATIRVGDGANVGAFDLVCISDVTNEVQVADADAIATSRVIGINPSNSAISDNSEGTILLHGFVRDDTWNWTTGATLYLGTGGTGSTITATAPSGTNDCVVPIGIALEPDMIYFNPTQTIIEHA